MEPRWTISTVSGPSEEPLSATDAKAHLKIEHSDEDDYISSLIGTARRYLERKTHRAFVRETFDYFADAFPDASDKPIELPRSPLVSVTSVKYTKASSTEATTLAATAYLVDTASEPGRVYLKDGQSWPTSLLRNANGVEVRFVAGHATSATGVPQDAKHAMRLLVEHWYYNRGAVVVGSISKPMEHAVDALTDDLKVKRYT